jgi:hypothetical protein
VAFVWEAEVLGTRFIEELLMLVDRGEADTSERLTADCDRRRTEIDRLVGSIAAGVPADSVAPAIKERQAELAKLGSPPCPSPGTPNIERLREASRCDRNSGRRACVTSRKWRG